MGLTIWNAYLAIRDALDYSCITNQRYPLIRFFVLSQDEAAMVKKRYPLVYVS